MTRTLKLAALVAAVLIVSFALGISSSQAYEKQGISSEQESVPQQPEPSTPDEGVTIVIVIPPPTPLVLNASTDYDVPAFVCDPDEEKNFEAVVHTFKNRGYDEGTKLVDQLFETKKAPYGLGACGHATPRITVIKVYESFSINLDEKTKIPAVAVDAVMTYFNAETVETEQETQVNFTLFSFRFRAVVPNAVVIKPKIDAAPVPKVQPESTPAPASVPALGGAQKT